MATTTSPVTKCAITHVIFDMDGLLLDTERMYEKAINTVCQKFGSTYTLEAKLQCLGRSATDGAANVIRICNLPITVDQYLDLMSEECTQLFSGQVNFLPGVTKLLGHLQAHNIPTAVATSGKRFYFNLKTKDHQQEFGQFSHVVIGSDDPELKNGKPHPDIFLLAMKRFPVQPESTRNVLVFEDSSAGVEGALAAGMQVVWIPDPCLDTTEHKADLIIPSMENFQPQQFLLPPYE